MREYFSESYFESRERFIRVARSAGGSLESIVHPSATGPAAEALGIDIATFGATNSDRTFLNVNGVHGVESYPGAAAQLQLMESGQIAEASRYCQIVLIHSLNPYGWAHRTQWNEDLCDLNRNFVDFANLPGSDELHYQIAEAVSFEELSLNALVSATDKLGELAKSAGKDRFGTALMSGQYIVPNSLKFGGEAPTWSNTVFRDIASRYLQSAEKVAFLDWHTGLGTYADTYELPFWQRGSTSWEKTVEMWGREAVERGSSGVTESTDQDTTPDRLNGLVLAGAMQAAPDATFAGGVIEFGTVPFNTIVQATILDMWLAVHGEKVGPEFPYWKQQVRTMFSPQDPQWESSVLSKAERHYASMLRVLRDW